MQNGVSVKLSNVMTSQQCQRGAQRFREQKDQRNDQSRPLCVFKLIKSLNLVMLINVLQNKEINILLHSFFTHISI